MTKISKPSLAETHPELAAQADGWDPRTVFAFSHKVVVWKCSRGHQWDERLDQRARGRNCPFCANKRILVGENDLATTDPEIAAQAHGWDPTTLTRGSGKKREWFCADGHVYVSAVSELVRGRGCGVCAGQQILVGVNDLQSVFPEVAREADGWDTQQVGHGSSKRLPWICVSGHRWTASVTSRTRLSSGCPSCAGNILVVGVNDLATKFPLLAEQADGWDPRTIAAGSDKKVKWKCQLGHTWTANVYNRSSKLSPGCPICSGKKVLAGFNDLKTTHPELAAQADGWDPTTLNAGSNKKVGWKCDLGHSWTANLNNRTNGRHCPICAGKKVLAGFNDLKTTHPEIAAEAFEWDPTKVGKGSDQRRWWICAEGHRWRTTPNSRTSGHKSGCPTCAQSGFDPNKSGFLYFVDHFDLAMFQIGITNFPDNRLGDHQRRGWEVIELRGPMDGHLTQKLETDCLHVLEKRGAVLGHKAGIEKFDGYSEAWTKKSLNVTSIKQILDWVYEDEAK